MSQKVDQTVKQYKVNIQVVLKKSKTYKQVQDKSRNKVKAQAILKQVQIIW